LVPFHDLFTVHTPFTPLPTPYTYLPTSLSRFTNVGFLQFGYRIPCHADFTLPSRVYTTSPRRFTLFAHTGLVTHLRFTLPHTTVAWTFDSSRFIPAVFHTHAGYTDTRYDTSRVWFDLRSRLVYTHSLVHLGFAHTYALFTHTLPGPSLPHAFSRTHTRHHTFLYHTGCTHTCVYHTHTFHIRFGYTAGSPSLPDFTRLSLPDHTVWVACLYIAVPLLFPVYLWTGPGLGSRLPHSLVASLRPLTTFPTLHVVVPGSFIYLPRRIARTRRSRLMDMPHTITVTDTTRLWFLAYVYYTLVLYLHCTRLPHRRCCYALDGSRFTVYIHGWDSRFHGHTPFCVSHTSSVYIPSILTHTFYSCTFSSFRLYIRLVSILFHTFTYLHLPARFAQPVYSLPLPRITFFYRHAPPATHTVTRISPFYAFCGYIWFTFAGHCLSFHSRFGSPVAHTFHARLVDLLHTFSSTSYTLFIYTRCTRVTSPHHISLPTLHSFAFTFTHLHFVHGTHTRCLDLTFILLHVYHVPWFSYGLVPRLHVTFFGSRLPAVRLCSYTRTPQFSFSPPVYFLDTSHAPSRCLYGTASRGLFFGLRFLAGLTHRLPPRFLVPLVLTTHMLHTHTGLHKPVVSGPHLRAFCLGSHFLYTVILRADTFTHGLRLLPRLHLPLYVGFRPTPPRTHRWTHFTHTHTLCLSTHTIWLFTQFAHTYTVHTLLPRTLQFTCPHTPSWFTHIHVVEHIRFVPHTLVTFSFTFSSPHISVHTLCGFTHYTGLRLRCRFSFPLTTPLPGCPGLSRGYTSVYHFPVTVPILRWFTVACPTVAVTAGQHVRVTTGPGYVRFTWFACVVHTLGCASPAARTAWTHACAPSGVTHAAASLHLSRCICARCTHFAHAFTRLSHACIHAPNSRTRTFALRARHIHFSLLSTRAHSCRS